jgi:hypothetical protein
MWGRVVMLEHPSILPPGIRSFFPDCFMKTLHNFQIILLIDCPALW